MANHKMGRFSTWSRETYLDPMHMPANRHYMPHFMPSGDEQRYGEGREKWFQDYRRSYVAEQTLTRNLNTLGSPYRPTSLSDKPDRVLGSRCLRQEAVLNIPRHHLINRIPDRERDRAQVDDICFQHRQQYKDQSGTLFGQKLDYFHIPTKAEEQFVPRMSPPEGDIGSYPSNTRAALEYTYDKERGPKDYELWPKV
ncbi:Protein FAM166C A [Acropora cervicornis]|uniref:Ciliary microtubule inner protein 2C n=1 Tax=Acropora cervicornis TaxID=6130 RepID=A0AAD9QGD1_ACRCE|nr:Protein FAM166C A [Acropora cervicornis]